MSSLNPKSPFRRENPAAAKQQTTSRKKRGNSPQFNAHSSSSSFLSSTGSNPSSLSGSMTFSGGQQFTICKTNKGLLHQQPSSGLRMNNGRVVPHGGTSISNAQEACRCILNTPREDIDMNEQQEILYGQECVKKLGRQAEISKNLQMDRKFFEFRLISLVDEAAAFQERRGGVEIGVAIRQDHTQNPKLYTPEFPSGNKNRAFMLTRDLVKHIRNDIRTLLYDTTMTPQGAAEPSYATKQIHGLNLFLESTYGMGPEEEL